MVTTRPVVFALSMALAGSCQRTSPAALPAVGERAVSRDVATVEGQVAADRLVRGPVMNERTAGAASATLNPDAEAAHRGPASANSGSDAAAVPCTPVPAAQMKSLEFELLRRAYDLHDRLVVQVGFDCPQLTSVPKSLIGFAASAHEGEGVVLALAAERLGAFALHGIRVNLQDKAEVGVAPKVGLLHAKVASNAVRDLFDALKVPLAARVRANSQTAPTVSPLHLPPSKVATTLEDMAFELWLSDAQGHVMARNWAGCIGSKRAEERLPLQIAWERFTQSLPQQFAVGKADDVDKQLLVELWTSRTQRPSWTDDLFLGMATVVANPALVSIVVPKLDSPHEQTRILAVNALAAITGWDVRRVRGGATKAAPEVIDEYRRHFASVK